MADTKRTRKTPKPDRLPVVSWVFALAPETVAASIPTAHLNWLTDAAPGSRLVRHDESGEVGHVYPDLHRTPHGWTVLAAKDAPTRCPGDCPDACEPCGSRDPMRWCDDCLAYSDTEVTA